MSGTYTRYTIEDADGCDAGVVFEEGEYHQAREYARANEGRVIAQEYEWSDSEMVDDFTPQGPSVCPDCDSDLDDDGACPLCADTTIEGPMHEAEAAYSASREGTDGTETPVAG